MSKTRNKNLPAICLLLAVCFFGAQNAVAQCSSSTIQGNCVKYVRSQVSPMPSVDLTSYSAKVGIINHQFPTVGSVAVMPAPGANAQYGHVAVVRAVRITGDGKLSLDIEESNWGDCAVTKRYNITPESRNIQGYYDPRYYNSGEATPQIYGMSNYTGKAFQEFYVGVSGTGFDTGSIEGIILGGWCQSFGQCKVPNWAIQNKTGSSMQVPVTLNSAGTYTLYLFNSRTGKTSNGQQIYVSW